ncbi:hypothetical protein GLYMA_09G126100v4 [Glycine max]|nr:hypothetical protein GLYMA_09G126100v4 [Glycine max]
MRLDDALEICREMDGVRPKPDACTMASLLLPAVTNTLPENVLYVKEMISVYMKNSMPGKSVDLYLQMEKCEMEPDAITCASRKKLCPNLLTENSLIDMYAGCGSLEDAKRVFDRMKFRNVASWTSLISAYGMTGQGYNAVAFFTEMQNSGQDSDSIAFVATLSACSHSVWGALLSSCRVYSNMDIGSLAADKLLQLAPEESGYYVLLSNIMQRLKMPCISNVELNNQVHTFLAGDTYHPQSKEIYEELSVLMGKMKELGYVPETDSALHDEEEEDKECHPAVHSEKLAIVFAILKTQESPMRITKNLRIYIVQREIVIRDTNQFHHFKDGICSCGDYW